MKTLRSAKLSRLGLDGNSLFASSASPSVEQRWSKYLVQCRLQRGGLRRSRTSTSSGPTRARSTLFCPRMSASPSSEDDMRVELTAPPPTCLQDWGALRRTPEHSRARRIGQKATSFQQVRTKVARHQPVSVLRRRGFDSRRLHEDVSMPGAGPTAMSEDATAGLRKGATATARRSLAVCAFAEL